MKYLFITKIYLIFYLSASSDQVLDVLLVLQLLHVRPQHLKHDDAFRPLFFVGTLPLQQPPEMNVFEPLSERL